VSGYQIKLWLDNFDWLDNQDEKGDNTGKYNGFYVHQKKYQHNPKVKGKREMIWTEHVKKNPGGLHKYREIYGKIGVVVYSRGDVSLTKEACEAIGNPTYVKCLSNGNKVGFVPTSEKDPNGYKVGWKSTNPENSNNLLFRVACKTFSDDIGWTRENKKIIYLGHIESGVLVFDRNKIEAIYD